MADVDHADLRGPGVPRDRTGWPPRGESFRVSECLFTVFNEEWHHRLFAERDLDALEALEARRA